MLRAVGKHNGHRGIGGFGVGVTRRSVVSERPKRTMRAESKNVLVQHDPVVTVTLAPVAVRCAGRPAAHGRRLRPCGNRSDCPRETAGSFLVADSNTRGSPGPATCVTPGLSRLAARSRHGEGQTRSGLRRPRVDARARRARAAGAARAGPGRGRVGAYPGYAESPTPYNPSPY